MPQKQKLSIEEKVKLIQDYLKGKVGLREAARRGGVSRDSITQWARNYDADGIEAFLPHKNRVYTPELKKKAVEDYLSGTDSQNNICKNIIFVNRRSSKRGSRCIILMETLTPQSFQEGEVT